jgi:hypothetical protein
MLPSFIAVADPAFVGGVSPKVFRQIGNSGRFDAFRQRYFRREP